MTVSTQMTRLVTSGNVAATAVLMIAVAGTPAATAAGDFGEHVSTCAQTSGFSAEHNPGMHQGFYGWDPTHTC